MNHETHAPSVTERGPETTHVSWGRRLVLPEGLPGHPGPARAHLTLDLIRDTGFLRGGFHIPGVLHLYISLGFVGEMEVKAAANVAAPEEETLAAVAALARIGYNELEARRDGGHHVRPDLAVSPVLVDAAQSGLDEWGLSIQRDFWVDGAEPMASWMPGTEPFVPCAGLVYASVGIGANGEPETSTTFRTFGQNPDPRFSSREYRTGISAGPAAPLAPEWGQGLAETLANRVNQQFLTDQDLLIS